MPWIYIPNALQFWVIYWLYPIPFCFSSTFVREIAVFAKDSRTIPEQHSNKCCAKNGNVGLRFDAIVCKRCQMLSFSFKLIQRVANIFKG
jgi:hypothetical protein